MITRIPEILHVLFLDIPPERIWSHIYAAVSPEGPHLAPDISKKYQEETFLNFCEHTLPNLNGDTRRLLFQHLDQQLTHEAQNRHIIPMPFLLLAQAGEELLTTRGDEPYCRCGKALEWRKLYQFLGQDTITCAFLADQDQKIRACRHDFSWPAVLRTNNERLNYLLRKGLAENHYHVNGSTQSLAITWCYAMNFPRAAKGRIQSEKFSRNLYGHVGYGAGDNVGSLSDRLELAAFIRCTLFEYLHSTDPNFDCADRLKSYYKHLDTLIPLENAIAVQKNIYGCYIHHHGTAFCLDYAMHRGMDPSNFTAVYRLLTGERALLYGCFSDYFTGKLPRYAAYLLYLYLMLKVQFRLEMIQSNQVHGFDNFSRYEKRKNTLWNASVYEEEAIRMSIYGPTHLEAVHSLEARFCPEASVGENIAKTLFYDLAEYEAAGEDFNREQLPQSICAQNPDDFLKLPYFYVLHFPKQADADPEPDTVMLRPRHGNYRIKLQKCAEAIATALYASNYFCNRIRGIDACSNELVCRPEVFGTAFRYLKGIKGSCSEQTSFLLRRKTWFLSATYHAGEDFYDIVDGLRTIDEAITFLELEQGDRLGHALAMGIDPFSYYSGRDHQILLPKQVCLDNFVWLIYRSRELGILIDPSSMERLRQKAIMLFRQIYCDDCHAGDNRFLDQTVASSLQEYYFSMQLRGDLPDLYQHMEYRYTPPITQCYKSYGVRRGDANLESYRENLCVSYLCYLYQYSEASKQRGNEMIAVTVDHAYCTAVREIQDAIQKSVRDHGLVIETNPTSNVSIGSFRRYKDHPIFRWNRHGLEYGISDSTCLHLPVCVNSDDLGVFDTSLEFEYALLFDALSKEVNEQGELRYRECEILDYLESLRQMGFKSIFPSHIQMYNRTFHNER